jgi:hypothetical protein
MMGEIFVASIKDATYTAYLEEPTEGYYYAIRTYPVEFPTDEFLKVTKDGEPIQLKCIICAQRNEEGLWIWRHLTPAAKEFFGDFLSELGADDEWVYFVLKLKEE